MNRRGNVFDAIPILRSLFFIILVAMGMWLFIDEFNTDIQNDPSINQYAKNASSNIQSQYPSVIDFWFIVLFVCLPLVSAVLAYFNNIHPLFFWVSLIAVLFILLWGAMYQEFWGAITEDSLLGTVALSFPMANFILSNYAFYSFIVFIIIAWGTFVKLRGRQNYGYGGWEI